MTCLKARAHVCRSLKDKGCSGCLVSGGCLPDGSVPLEGFFKVFSQVKRELGLTLAVHTGIVKESTAHRLKESGVDVALIDIIGSDDTIREIYQLNAKAKDYEDSLKALSNSGIPFVPHVIIGLHYGRLKGEISSLEMISKYNPKAVVIIALIPIKRTGMETITPPSPEDIATVLAKARILLPKTPIVLGCMRPTGKHRTRTDTLAVEAGVNAIAFPEEEAIRLAESMGLKMTFSLKCCSQIYEDIYHNIDVNRTE